MGQRARWGSVPRHCTWCTQKLLFWLRFFRLPRERSGNRGISGGERLPCRCPLPRAGPYLELGSFSFVFHSFLQGAWMEVGGAQHPHPVPLPSPAPHGSSWGWRVLPWHAGALSPVAIPALELCPSGTA